MRSNRARNLSIYALVASSLSLILSGSAVFADSHSGKDASVITCPPELHGLRMSFSTKYRPPRGWGHADVKGIKSKGGGHSDLSPVLLSHSVKSRNLLCSYGYGGGERTVVLATIKQTMPKNVSCTTASEFSFRCVPAAN